MVFTIFFEVIRMIKTMIKLEFVDLKVLIDFKLGQKAVKLVYQYTGLNNVI